MDLRYIWNPQFFYLDDPAINFLLSLRQTQKQKTETSTTQLFKSFGRVEQLRRSEESFYLSIIHSHLMPPLPL